MNKQRITTFTCHFASVYLQFQNLRKGKRFWPFLQRLIILAQELKSALKVEGTGK